MPKFLNPITITTPSGSAPLIVNSSTLVTNLNADLLDGQHGSFYQNAGNLNAGTLQAARLPAFSGGDVTSTAGTVALTLANSGVTAGTYTKVTVDAKGRVTTGALLASADLPTYTGTITSGQVTTALGFTPYNATNPSGYITSTASITGYSGGISVSDSRAAVTTPQSINMGVVFDFKQNTTDGLSDGGTYFGEMTFRQYGSGTDWSGGSSHQLGFTDNGNIWQRSGSNTTWGAWKKLLDTSNFSSHALPLSGGTLTGQLFSNSKIETAGTVTGSIFYGAGTGLTGTAPSLTAGAVPWTGVTGKPTTLAGYGITDALPLAGGTLSGLLTAGAGITMTGGRLYVSSAASGQTYGGTIHIRDDQATGANNSFAGIAFSSAPGADFVIGKYSNAGVARLQIRNHQATTLVTIEVDGSASFAGGLTATNFTGPGTGLTGTAASLTAGAVPWSGVTGKPTTLAGYGITDALNTSGTAQTKSGNLTVNSALTSGGAFYAATTVQYSNRQPIYTIYYGGGQDLAWKKVADITIGTGLYRGVTFKVDVVDNQGNFGWNSNCLTLTYFASCIRSGGVQDVPNDAVVTGPVADYVRVVKTATGVYELQIRQLADWQTYVFTVEATINSGGNTVTYASSTPPNGSTTGTIYTATPGWTSRLANIAVAGSGSFAGQITSTVATGTAPLVITSTTAVANLNSDLLDGQHGSYFEGRDTTAVGFSGGTLTLTRAAGNLTANLDGRYLPLAGGTMSGDLTATRIRGVNSLVLNTFTTVNPASNVFLYSQPNDRDAWLFLDSADTGSNWGIYHRQIDSAVSGLPANSIGFIGGGSSALQAWISLANGSANFQGALTQAGNQVLHAGNYTSYALPIGGGTLTGGLSGTTGSFSGQITSTVATGTAPFVVTSTTQVNNLNAQLLGGQLSTYYAAASSLTNYLPLSGGTLTGSLALHSNGGSSGFVTGTGDAATYALYNFKLSGWNGMAFENPTTGGAYPSQIVGVVDFRNGTIDMKGGFKVNGASVITENQSITISGDASGTGKTAINLTLANSGVTAGTYRSVTTDAKGRVTAGTNPTTLAGYGITDALPLTGGTLTGSITINGVSDAVVVQTNGNAAQWYGRISVRNSTSDRSSFLGTYQGVAGVFAHNNALNAWADLYVNTVDGTSGGIVRMSSDVRIGGNAALHAATTSAPNLSIGGSAARWATGRTISLTGDVSGTSAAFDGTAALSFATTLANSGVGAGTYRSVTVNAKGLVTAGTNPTTISGYGITDAMYQVDPNGFTQGDINGSGNMQRLWGTDSVQNLIAFRPPTTVEYTTDNVNWVATTISNDVFDGKVFGKWAGFNMNVGSNIGAWTKVRMTWVNFGYHFFSHFTLCHSTNGHSMNFVFYKSDLSGVFSSEAYRVNGISSWPGYTFTSHVNVSGHWDTRDVRMVFELNGNNGPSGYPNNAISIGHIGIMGGYSSFNRVFDWDGNRNITLFGNLTLPGNVSATGTVSGSSFSGAGTNLTGTANSLNVGGYSARWATGRTIALTGDVTGTSGAFDGTAALSFGVTIANSAVTYAKIQNVATASVLGNSSASAAQAPAALSMATLAGMLSNQAMNINGSATSVPWTGVTGKPTTLSGYGITDALPLSGGTVSGVVRINNQLQVGQNTNGTAYIDAYGGYAWFGRDSNSAGIRIDGSANVHMTAALNVVGAITQNGNQVLHAGNYTSYTLPRGGAWYGASLPGTRWGGFSANGGEIVFGQDLPAAGQMGILIDGCYIAAENNGFWSLASSNDWTTRRGMYFDGTYLRFDYNSATAYFHNASIGGNQVLHAGNVSAYTAGSANAIADGAVSTTAKIANSVVTYAKIQNVAAASVLGNSSASAAQAPVEIGMATLAGMLSNQTMNINGSSASCTGNAATATNGFTVKPGWAGNQNLILEISNFNNSLPSGFYQGYQATNSPSATWYNLINIRHSNTANDHGFQLAMSYYDETLWSRSYQGGTGANNGTFTAWRAHLHSGNFSSYALPLTGGTLTGTLTAPTLQLANGFQIQQGASSYGQFSNWVHLNGSYGFYSGVNNAHIYPNNATYGAWRIQGTRGGWGGIEFENNNVSLMMGSDTVGFHQNSNGWLFRVHQGVGYIYKGSWGGGTAATILDSSNYNSYALPLTGGTLTGRLTARYTDGTSGWDSIQIDAAPTSGGAYIRANRATAGTGEVGYAWATGGVNKWINYLNVNSDTLGWYQGSATVMTLTTGGALAIGGAFTAASAAITGAITQNGNQVLHAGNYATSYLNGTYLRAAGHPGYGDWNTFGNTAQTVHQMFQENFNLPTSTGSSNFPTNASYKYGTLINFGTGADARAQVYISHAGNDLVFRGGWGTAGWNTWNRCVTDVNFPSFGTHQASIGNSLPTTVFMSTDANIRQAPFATAKAHLGITSKWANSRPNNTGDTNYWTGVMGWGTTDWNTVFDWGSGFTDSWSGPANNPGDTSHHVGVQAVHYTNGSGRYGWQMVNGAGTNRWWLRDVWGGGFSSWREVIHSGNYTSYAPNINGGSTIAGITYFSNGESIQAYGIRGRFTNEYLHLYNKVGVGNPNGWGQGEGSTPDKGLSTYGGINVAYGNNAASTFNGAVNVTGALTQNGNQVLHTGNYTSYTFGLSTNNAVSGSNTYTNTNLFKSAVGSTVYLGSANTPPLQAYSSDGGPAFMSFHRGGSYAVNMGLDPDNVLRIGGWSAAANRWQLDMSGNNTIPGTMTAASFSGAGTGLTGTAASLSIGGSAGSVAASGITGQTGMWTSAARPGPYRLYRRDVNDGYSVQNYWTGTYWRLDGYFSNDTVHAGCSVAYADTAGSVSTIADGAVSTTAKLANSVVTYAKIQNVGSSSVLGNTSASVSQAPQEITFANLGPYINGVARAWVTFNENPSTGAITINASLGISSVTRINYGQYRVNFSTAFADANYAVSGTIGYESNGGYLYGGFLNIPRVATPKTTTYCEVTASYGDGNTYNARFVHVVFDR